MDGSVWVILPTYDEAENLEAVVGGVRAAAPEAQILVVDDNSRDGTAELADALAAEDDPQARTSCTGRARPGSGARTRRASRYALDAGAGLRDRDGRRPLTRSGRPAAADRARAGRRRPGARLPLRARAAGSRTGGSIGGCSRAGAAATPGACSGVDVRDLTGGFKCFRAGALRAVDFESATAHGLRVPGRADVARAERRAEGRRGADPVPRAAARRVEDVRPDRSGGGVEGSGPALRVAAVAPAGGGGPTCRCSSA